MLLVGRMVHASALSPIMGRPVAAGIGAWAILALMATAWSTPTTQVFIILGLKRKRSNWSCCEFFRKERPCNSHQSQMKIDLWNQDLFYKMFLR